MAENSWWKDRISELSTRMGAGLLGKAAPVFGLCVIFTIAAMFALPDGQKIFALYAFLAVFVAWAATVLLILWRHPILGNMDGEDALKYFKADYAAKNPKIIPGTSRVVANTTTARVGRASPPNSDQTGGGAQR